MARGPSYNRRDRLPDDDTKGTYREFFDWGFGYAAQSPFRRDKKITTESVAGMFDDNVVAAPCAKCAYCVMSAKTVLQNRIEESNAQFFRPILVPTVEQPAYKDQTSALYIILSKKT